MKIIEKITAYVSVLVMCLALCACGADAQPTAETEPPEPEVTSSAMPALYISELMPANKCTLPDAAGNFPDWVELYNAEDEAVSLKGYTLSDGKNIWGFPDIEIGAGEYLVVFCDKKGAEGLCASFSLSAAGETLTLAMPDGTVLDAISYADAADDMSLACIDGGDFFVCANPTPGYENTAAGYCAMQTERETPALSINEAAVFNRRYAEKNGEFSDWVELKNNSDEPVLLSDYYISDKGSDRMACRLPEITLKPGGIYVWLCDEGGFSLDAEYDKLFLSDSEGILIDFMPLRGIPSTGSFGRMEGENGFFYFLNSSPEEENTNGARLISAPPVSHSADGVFEGVSSVTVELEAQGEIYYTLDGSLPTAASACYTSPLTIEKTAVLRAVSIEPGKLQSSSLDLSFIINEGHSLPVASLVVDPYDMFGNEEGIYSNPHIERERPGSISFFDGDDRFTVDCGVKLHGATSRTRQEKKSFKLMFRSAYGGKLNYDLFGNGVTEFVSVLMRNAQESSFDTNVRDICLHELAAQCSDALSTQAHKYCILYINGEYWGIYAFREAHSAEHFANHTGYDADKVEMYKERWAKSCGFAGYYDILTSLDMSKPENYALVAPHIDLDALAAWMIIEGYSGNVDMNSPNVRFYYTEQDEVLHYALVDVDLGFFSRGSLATPVGPGEEFSTLPYLLLKNSDFKHLVAQRMSEYLHGPLSKENVHRVLDGIAAELRPEIERDGAKWGYTLKQWENELQLYMYDFADNGYVKLFAGNSRGFLDLTREEFEALFGDL